jgi:DNA-binding transcriptional LysR family regulator
MGQLAKLAAPRGDLDAASVFVSVVEAGSFRGAARALGIPKSTVSRRVAELEERLGARLLQRTTRRVGLTEVGEAYHRHARAAVASIVDAERAVSDLGAEPRGLLRVTAPANFGAMMFPQLVAAFMRAEPHVQVSVDFTDRQVDLVEDGYDVAVRAGALADSSMIAHRLGSSPFLLVASPTYLRTHGTPKAPRDLAKHDCLIFGLASPASWVFETSRRRVSVDVKGPLSANSFSVVREAAIAGLGIARVPSFFAAEGIRTGQLRALLERYAPPPAALNILYPSARQLSPKVRAFVAFVRENIVVPV